MNVKTPTVAVGSLKKRNAELWLLASEPLNVPLAVSLPIMGLVTVNVKVNPPLTAAPVPVEVAMMSPKLELLGVLTVLPVEPANVSVVVLPPPPKVVELVPGLEPPLNVPVVLNVTMSARADETATNRTNAAVASKDVKILFMLLLLVTETQTNQK